MALKRQSNIFRIAFPHYNIQDGWREDYGISRNRKKRAEIDKKEMNRFNRNGINISVSKDLPQFYPIAFPHACTNSPSPAPPAYLLPCNHRIYYIKSLFRRLFIVELTLAQHPYRYQRCHC